MKLYCFIAAASIALLPAMAEAEEPCPRQPLPSPLVAAGYSPAKWPPGETVRFSARPSSRRYAFAVQIHRPDRTPRGASVRVAKLVRQWDCNRYDLEKAWLIQLSRQESEAFFGELGRLLRLWRDRDEIVLDGTGFEFEHRVSQEVRRIRLSAAAEGLSGQISALILRMVDRPQTRGYLPDKPSWFD